MRKTAAYFLFLTMAGFTALTAQTKAPPAKLVFPAKNGNVAFDHSAHAKREKNNCNTCHGGLFAQAAGKPLGFKPPHKNQEDKQVSCGACHRAGGTAFETKGNCGNAKCHVRPGAAK